MPALLKSKWLWITIIVSSLIGFTYHYGNLKENLANAYNSVTSITTALQTANESMQRLEKQMEILDQKLIERQELRDDVIDEYNKQLQYLTQERKSNVSLDKCWDVSFSDDYLERLRNESAGNDRKRTD